ncbi:hypothetical protein FBX97_4609 [Herbaspirillum sp. SJZ107]|nr:hypothetical protein FBX97_4609 [Herbaspirillum sp. SJZ107]
MHAALSFSLIFLYALRVRMTMHACTIVVHRDAERMLHSY